MYIVCRQAVFHRQHFGLAFEKYREIAVVISHLIADFRTAYIYVFFFQQGFVFLAEQFALGEHLP